jgi:PHP family Zn ribbon phosphoesterase
MAKRAYCIDCDEPMKRCFDEMYEWYCSQCGRLYKSGDECVVKSVSDLEGEAGDDR